MLWATMVISIRNNDWRSRAVLSIFTRERVQVCGREVIVYVSIAWKSCASFRVRTHVGDLARDRALRMAQNSSYVDSAVAVASRSGQAAMISRPTPIPIDTSTNRCNAATHAAFSCDANTTIARVVPAKR